MPRLVKILRLFFLVSISRGVQGTPEFSETVPMIVALLLRCNQAVEPDDDTRVPDSTLPQRENFIDFQRSTNQRVSAQGRDGASVMQITAA